MVTDLGTEELAIETSVYRMRNQLRVAGRVVERLKAKGGGPRFRMSAKQGGPLQTETTTADPRTSTELAVVMSPFLLPSSDLYVDKLLDLLGGITSDAEVTGFVAQAKDALVAARTKSLNVTINGKALDAGAVFEEIARNILFADDTAAIQYRAKLESDPFMGPLKWFVFHDHCLEVYGFLVRLMGFFEAAEGRLPRFQRDYLCIYCKRADARFSTVEHTLPESLGNNHSVLPRGYVCDDCQRQSADIEQVVLDQVPFALTKILAVQHTKKGKFPSARFPQVHLERTSPNSIRMTGQGGKSPIVNEKRLPDGTISFQIQGTSTRFDHVAVGRVLVKGALGGMALEKGRDYVLDARFDAAREFIRTGKGLNNRLALFKENKPSGLMQLSWVDRPELGVAAHLVIHGTNFLIGLTEKPLIPPDPELLARAFVFDLWNPEPGPHHTLPKEVPGDARVDAPSNDGEPSESKQSEAPEKSGNI